MTEQRTIFVVDDDVIFRRVIGKQLEQAGFLVRPFENGVGVVAQVREVQPVACILDMVMQGRGGADIMLDLNKLFKRPKIIGVSGSKLFLDYAYAFQADATLQKPISSEVLMQTLAKLGVWPTQGN